MIEDRLHALVADSFGLAPTGSGPLDGIEFVAKDIFSVQGHVASFGLARWRETHAAAESTATVLTELLQGGARLMGINRLDQLAFSLVGDLAEGTPPRNPRFPDHFCGGSSSGSAAAVAGGMAALGIGTDTAGSIRVPAGVCAIHGLRPTWGRITSQGCLPLAPSFDTVGVLAANPTVLRRSFECLRNEAAEASPRPLQRVLVDPRLWSRMGPVERTAAGAAAGAVGRALGAPVEEISLEHLVNRDVGALFARLEGREVWATHGTWVSEHSDALHPEVLARMTRCREWWAEPAEQIALDMQDRNRYRELLEALAPPECVVVLPVVGRRGPMRDDGPEALAHFHNDALILNSPASLTGRPQLCWSNQGWYTTAPSDRAPSDRAPSDRAPSDRGDPALGAVGLLGAAGADEQLLDLLCRLWAQPWT